MIYRRLGNTREEVSVLGQGTIGAGGRTNSTEDRIRSRIEVTRAGIDLGITFLDTAEDYEDGHAEEVLGKALKGIREKVFISGKFKPENSSFAGVIKAAEGSLRRLGTDRIDLYQIHWPNPRVPLAETLEAMVHLVQQGKVRHLGVSNLTTAQLDTARKVAGDRVVSLQTEYSLFNRGIEADVLPYCESHALSLIAYSPLRGWDLKLTPPEREVCRRLEAKYSVTTPQIFLNWLVSRDNVLALTQTMNPAHLRENARATEFSMEKEDLDDLGGVFSRQPVPIPTDQVRVLNLDADETHRIYTTLEEALLNELRIEPSPAAIAEELSQGAMLRPVELIQIEGRPEYHLTHGRVRYWAWIIAFGPDVPIPAYVTTRPTGRETGGPDHSFCAGTPGGGGK